LGLLDFDYLFWLNPAKANVAGLSPISLRLTLAGQRAEVSTKLRCLPSQWESVTHRLLEKGKQRHPSAKAYNQALDLLESKVVLLRATLPAGTTLAELREALSPTPQKPVAPAPPMSCVLALLEEARLKYPNHATRATATTALRKFRTFVNAPTLPLPDLTAEYCMKFAAWVRDGKGANTALAMLRALFAKACPGLVNPFPSVSRKVQRTAARPRYVLTKAEIARLAGLVLAPGTRAAWARDIYLAQYYLHGSRVGVIIELTWDQVDWAGQRVSFQAEKGGVWHDVALRPQLAALLHRYYPGPGARELVFPLLPANFFAQDSGQRFRLRKAAATKVWKGLQVVGQLAGLSGQLHSHTARHSLATHTVEQTGDYRLAQRFLGHSTLQMTERYVRPMLTGELDAGADKVYNS
jgi:integrase/recombinase XerD